MIRRARLWLGTLIFSGFASSGAAQQLPAHLSELADPRAQVRIGAFYRLISQKEQVPSYIDAAKNTTKLLAAYPAFGQQIGSALIGLLEHENQEWKTAAVGSMTDARSSFYGDVIASVAALKDTRSIPTLIGAIGTGSLAADGLVALGDIVVPSVTSVQASSIVMERVGAVAVLGKLLNRGIQESTVEAVRAGLIRGLKDSNPLVRKATIVNLAPISDQTIVNAINHIAATDSSEKTRSAANSWLEKRRRRP